MRKSSLECVDRVSMGLLEIYSTIVLQSKDLLFQDTWHKLSKVVSLRVQRKR